MSEEQLPGQSSGYQVPEVSKRRRTPSQYASRIADFKSNFSVNFKKTKSNRQLDSLEVMQTQEKFDSNRRLGCILPSGKRYALSIVVGTNKSSRIDKNTKKKSKINNPEALSAVKIKEQKKKDAGDTFFDKFLLVCEELQKKDGNEQKQGMEVSRQNGQSRNQKREERVRREKDREQKWVKCYERMKCLSQRLDHLVANFTFLTETN